MLDKAIEECCELVQALLKFKQNRMNNVEEEMADVEIMLEQLHLMFSDTMVNEYKRTKLDRLEKRLLE